MRLAGRIAAAIEVLGDIQARHRPAAEALKDWGIAHRFAGAGDRAAIGNLVYDALRRRASIAWRMEGDTPWHLAVGAALFEWGIVPRELNENFRDDPHAPPAIPEERLARLDSARLEDAPEHVRADVPEWTAKHFQAALGADWVDEGRALAGRPPLDLRVNTLKADRDKVARQLARLAALPTPLSPVGLRVAPVEGPRRHPNVQAEEGFQRGRFEVQDEGSQLCALLVGSRPGEQVLDFCAGAGGKTLAIAAGMNNKGRVVAMDVLETRLDRSAQRLRRAGAHNVERRALSPDNRKWLKRQAGAFDRVLVDAPCTGTGTWRRNPDGRWTLRPEDLAELVPKQAAILDAAARLVKPGGGLIYATCSVLPAENERQIEAFLQRNPEFAAVPVADVWRDAMGADPPPEIGGPYLRLSPLRHGTDGFFAATLVR
jgi:16S rRNA (cytosine967-C5)-methyltransferase